MLQIINLILTLITLGFKHAQATEEKKKELKNDIDEAVDSRDLSLLNSVIERLR